MPVQFDYGKCVGIPRKEELATDNYTGEKFHPVTDEWWQIIQLAMWRGLVIGIPQITVKNRAEWYSRSEMFARISGGPSITPEQVITLTGFSVNSTPESMTAFRKRIWDGQVMSLRWEFNQVANAEAEKVMAMLAESMEERPVTGQKAGAE